MLLTDTIGKLFGSGTQDGHKSNETTSRELERITSEPERVDQSVVTIL